MKKFNYKGDYIIPVFGNYVSNGSLALQFKMLDDTPYATVTVNLVDETPDEDCAFLDVNNLGDNIAVWLFANGFGKLTGKVGFSGFCIYPEFKFNREMIEEFKYEG